MFQFVFASNCSVGCYVEGCLVPSGAKISIETKPTKKEEKLTGGLPQPIILKCRGYLPFAFQTLQEIFYSETANEESQASLKRNLFSFSFTFFCKTAVFNFFFNEWRFIPRWCIQEAVVLSSFIFCVVFYFLSPKQEKKSDTDLWSNTGLNIIIIKHKSKLITLHLIH